MAIFLPPNNKYNRKQTKLPNQTKTEIIINGVNAEMSYNSPKNRKVVIISCYFVFVFLFNIFSLSFSGNLIEIWPCLSQRISLKE